MRSGGSVLAGRCWPSDPTKVMSPRGAGAQGRAAWARRPRCALRDRDPRQGDSPMSRSYPQNLWSVARVRGGFPFCDGAMSVTLNCAAAASGRCTRERQGRPGGTRAAEPSIDHTAQSVGPAFPDAQARGRGNRNRSIRWRPSSRPTARPVLIVVHDSQGGTEPPMHAAEASEEPGAPALCGAGPAQGTRAGRAG